MFDFIRQHTRILFFVLILLIIPSFVFFGIEGYSSFRDNNAKAVAHVGGVKITQAEWDAAHREQVERARQQAPTLDLKAFDTPELRQRTLDNLIRDRLMVVAADKLHLVTTDERMARIFRTDPEFQALRNPDGSVNRGLLSAQGMSSEVFAARLRQGISSDQVLKGVDTSALAPASAASAALDAFFQQREIQVQRFDANGYAGKVKPTDDQIEAYYKDPKHSAEFQAPEQVKIEYVVLDLDTLKKDVVVNEDELKKYYAENETRYTTPVERRASHILVKVEKSASEADRAKAKAKAQELLAAVKKAPATFADVARKNSDDQGSAQNGGDLDFFGKGSMVKPFEDAAFSLKQGDISDIVTSDFGYHIIQVTGTRGGDKRSYESVRPEIEALLRTQLAQKKYTELAAEFGNAVYEQADSLKPIADKYKLELKTAQGLGRTPVPNATGPLASPKLLESIFSAESIRSKRNTDAVETAPSQLVSARVLEHSPARLLPLAEIKDKVTIRVVAEQAAALARKDGEARLAALKAAPTTAMTEASVVVSRVDPGNLPQNLVEASLRAPSTPLPSVVGVDLGAQGYAVVKVSKVLPKPLTAAETTTLRADFRKAVAEAEMAAYYDALKTRFKVDKSASTTAAAASAPAN